MDVIEYCRLKLAELYIDARIITIFDINAWQNYKIFYNILKNESALDESINYIDVLYNNNVYIIIYKER